ncbi:MAG TPA: hypothetical protein VGG74_08860 [Kofleriaceae bacterium]|jgi:hypothetical protein
MRARSFTIAVLVVWSAGASGGPDKHAYEKLLCAGRARCSVADVTAVGAGKVVVKLEIPDENAASEMDGCAAAEHWLVVGNAAKPTQRQLLASGYTGACGAVGNDGGVTGTTFNFDEYVGGGHPDHYDHSISLSLSPLGFESEHGNDAARFPDTNVTEYSWSWGAFSGSGAAHFFRCDSSGHAISENEPAGPYVHWATLPALPESVDGFPHLDACSTSIDGVHAGYTIFGHAGSATDASFRAAIAGHELLVEVTDDHWTGPGKDPTYDDHVEIWLTQAASPLSLDTCENLRATDAQQWGVRIVDGKVFPGYGKPATNELHVRRSPGALKDGAPAMLAITLPGWFDPKTSGITVVYSDSDDGATQKRLIATSELAYGKRYTLGRARDIAPNEATCRVRAGKLEPVLNHTFTSDAAIATWSD